MSYMPILADDVIIRHFKPQDLVRVHRIFEEGIAGLVPELVSLLFKEQWRRVSICHPVVVVFPIVAGVSWQLGLSLDTAFKLAIALGMVWHVVSWIWFTVTSDKFFYGYIKESLASDLSNIPSVYVQPGGFFLVAELSGKVVGMCGAELKELQEEQPIFELRRMFLDQTVQGQGVGMKLFLSIEQLINEKKTKSLVLTTSNVQYKALAFYKRAGFQLIGEGCYPKSPKEFQVLRYQKFY